MGAVAGETAGTVADFIPRVVAGLPGEGRSERVEEIVKSPAHEHVVVRGEHKGDNNRGHANACGVTRGRGGHKVRDGSAQITASVTRTLFHDFLCIRSNGLGSDYTSHMKTGNREESAMRVNL